MDAPLHLLALSVGNTTTRAGRFENAALVRALRAPNAGFNALIEQIVALMDDAPEGSESDGSSIVIASVNEPVAQQLIDALTERVSRPVYRLGTDLPIPIVTALAPHATPGQDRLLNALAAFDHMKQACVVVDAGTAVTVDFVDGEGVFQGGAIAPGATMQLHALHAHTAGLPHIHIARPSADVFGKDTNQAMLNGVYYGIRGLVRSLVERYAEAYEAYPPIIATGGDAPLIFEGDEQIDRIVPDLTLWGIESACRRALASEDGLDE